MTRKFKRVICQFCKKKNIDVKMGYFEDYLMNQHRPVFVCKDCEAWTEALEWMLRGGISVWYGKWFGQEWKDFKLKEALNYLDKEGLGNLKFIIKGSDKNDD
jgi:hypothetical protein